jgi:hypothetical protein
MTAQILRIAGLIAIVGTDGGPEEPELSKSDIEHLTMTQISYLEIR